MNSMRFDRCNLLQLALDKACAHGGEGRIGSGRHAEDEDEDELYLVLAGEGSSRDGEPFAVHGGDLARNRAGGEHGLRNTGATLLKLFVFELRVVP